MKRSNAPSQDLKVALVAFDFPEYTVSVANGLAAQSGVGVCLYMPEELGAQALADIDSRVRLAELPGLRLRQPVAQLSSCGNLVRSINEEGADVVHIQHGHLWFNWYLRRLKAPIVLTVHDASHHPGDRSQRTPQWILHFGFRRATRLIAHAESVRNSLVRLGHQPNRISVIPHPAIGVLPERVRDPDPVPTVLFFGRIWPYKGLEFLLEAAPAISESIPDVKFVIAGQGENFSRYRQMMQEPERFEVINRYVTNSERAELFDRSSVVALPYVEASQSGVVPMAYSHGRAIVATRVGGLPEAIDDGLTGLLVPPRDARGLAQALVKILEDRDYGDRLGQEGRRKLERELSPAAVARKTVDTYRAALRGSEGGDRRGTASSP